MKPVEFEGQNVVMGKDQPEYQDLPALITEKGQVIQCWELSEYDKKMIQETGKIWVSQLTFNQPLQPILLQVEPMVNITYTTKGEKPVINESEKPNQNG